MKVVQISGAYIGAQKVIEDAIHNALQNRGHESYIFHTYGESRTPYVVKYEGKFGCYVRRALWKLTNKKQISAAFSTAKLIGKIKKISPDIVHIHTIHHGHVDYPMLYRFLAKKKIPTVHTVHDMWTFTGGCYHYTDIGCDGYKNGCINCPMTESSLDCSVKDVHRNFQRKKRLLKQLDKLCFVSVSDWVNQQVVNTHLNQYPQYIVLNALPGTEALSVAREENHASNPFIILGVAAGWTEKKGIFRFFELAKLLGEKVEIILVGEASQKITEAAPPNITFLGRVSQRSELQKLYASVDLHVSMSLEETFGMTFVEAALSGTRSMGFDSTAIPYTLKKVKGIILPPNDVSAVAEKILALGSDRSLCRLQQTEIAEIKELFSVDKMAKQYLDIYTERLNSL